MKRALRGTGSAVLATLVLANGCANLQHQTRVERGETLRHYERKSIQPDTGTTATFDIKYPELVVHFIRSDNCRTEEVDEYPETTIDEVSNPAAGPALATGVVCTLVGGGFLAARNLFSNDPNRSTLDQNGHYGPAPRQVDTGWSIVGIAVGVPGLVVAGVGYAQQGTRTSQRTVEDVVRRHDGACHASPLEGEVVLTGTEHEIAPFKTESAAITLNAKQIHDLGFNGFVVAGRTVTLSSEQDSQLTSFEACAEALATPVPASTPLNVLQRNERRLQAESCNKLPGEPARALLDALDHASKTPPPPPSGAETEKSAFDESPATGHPHFRIEQGSPDLAKLPPPAALVDVALWLRGVLRQRFVDGRAILDVGDRAFMIVLPESPRFATDFPEGSRVEIVGRGALPEMGPQGELPVVNAGWIRRAVAR